VLVAEQWETRTVNEDPYVLNQMYDHKIPLPPEYVEKRRAEEPAIVAVNDPWDPLVLLQKELAEENGHGKFHNVRI